MKILIFAALIAISSMAKAHGGGVDEAGCHSKRVFVIATVKIRVNTSRLQRKNGCQNCGIILVVHSTKRVDV